MILHSLALIVVLLAGLYFIGLGVVSLVAPARGAMFLHGFAGSPAAHYTELVVRIVAGGAFILRAPDMTFPTVFTLFGWALVLTSAGLFAVPWQWHQRFARRTVPHAVRYLGLVAVASLALGGFVLLCAVPM